MPVDAPVQPDGRQRADRPRGALLPGAERGDVDAVNSIARPLPPEKGCPCRDCQSLLHGEAQVRIERQRIGRAYQTDGVRVGRSGKERVECLQSVIVRVFISARRVGAQSQPGFERNPVYCVAHVRRQGPGANADFTPGAFEVSPLKNRIEVVIELSDRVVRGAISARDSRVAAFAPATLVEAPYFAVQRDVSELMAAADLRSGTSRADAPASLRRVRRVIDEPGLDRDQLIDLPVDQPRAMYINHSHAIEAAAHVQPFTGGDQSPGAEIHLVASDTHGQRIRFIAEFQIEEGLMDFQTVIISWSRPAVAPAPDGALQLGKDADSIAEMRVGVQQIALQ